QAEPDFSYPDQDEVAAEFSHRSGTDSVAFEVWMDLAESLPVIGEFSGISATTSGYYGTTPDHNPFLGYDPDRRNLVRLVGFSGHGAMFGPFTAKVAVALAEEGRAISELDVLGSRVSLGRFAPDRELGAHETMVI
ncbi:MAG: FAD-dependent oxidoreductase, partial [Myxococcota bacterium]|nr:FAD-dependent oxidoreductase [Myxococcota bacterium]